MPSVYKRHEDIFLHRVMETVSSAAFILPPMESLNAIGEFIRNKKQGVYMRFGDGDVFLATGKKDMLQQTSNKLSREMQEAFSMRGPGIIKALAIHSDIYGREKEMYVGNHLQKDKMSHELLRFAFPYFVGYPIFSPVALHYAATYEPCIANEFLRLLKRECVLFIGNENTSSEVINKLFGPVMHVKTPAENAYDKIDLIELEACRSLEKLERFGVVVVSMGCSGRILMKRLYKNNYKVFYFDFGSLLDGICGNETRPWLKETIHYDTLLKDL